MVRREEKHKREGTPGGNGFVNRPGCRRTRRYGKDLEGRAMVGLAPTRRTPSKTRWQNNRMRSMPLTDTEIKKIKPAKPIKLSDGRGLLLQVVPSWWQVVAFSLSLRWEAKRFQWAPIRTCCLPRLERGAKKRGDYRPMDLTQRKSQIQKSAKTEQSANSFEVVARE